MLSTVLELHTIIYLNIFMLSCIMCLYAYFPFSALKSLCLIHHYFSWHRT